MSPSETHSIDSPHETRPFRANGHMDVITLGDFTLGRGTFEPGWRWSQDVKPIAGTESCQATHFLYCVSGRMGIRMADGSEGECGPGDVVSIAPDHDAWVVGDEPCVAVDFGGYSAYARG